MRVMEVSDPQACDTRIMHVSWHVYTETVESSPRISTLYTYRIDTEMLSQIREYTLYSHIIF